MKTLHQNPEFGHKQVEIKKEPAFLGGVKGGPKTRVP